MLRPTPDDHINLNIGKASCPTWIRQNIRPRACCHVGMHGCGFDSSCPGPREHEVADVYSYAVADGKCGDVTHACVHASGGEIHIHVKDDIFFLIFYSTSFAFSNVFAVT
jgi:hypothetical protein